MESTPIKGLKVDKVSPTSIDGLDGYELLATGERKSGTRISVFSVLLFEEANYWIALGTAPLAQRDAAVDRFTKIINSLQRGAE